MYTYVCVRVHKLETRSEVYTRYIVAEGCWEKRACRGLVVMRGRGVGRENQLVYGQIC